MDIVGDADDEPAVPIDDEVDVSARTAAANKDVVVASALSTSSAMKVTVGLRLEAKDYNGLWYPAKVMDIDEEKQVSHKCYRNNTLFVFYKNVIFWPKPSKEIEIATNKITTMFLILGQFQALTFL